MSVDIGVYNFGCIEVTIIASPSVEEDETFTVTVTATDLTTRGLNVTTITITDSDSKYSSAGVSIDRKCMVPFNFGRLLGI